MQAQPDQELAPASHSIGLAPAPLSLSISTTTTIVVVVVVFAYISRLKRTLPTNKQTKNMSQMFEEQNRKQKGNENKKKIIGLDSKFTV